MHKISQVVGNLVAVYFADKSKFSEVRLVLPGFTTKISEEIHKYLLSKGIKTSYLVVSDNNAKPEESYQVIQPSEAVNIRIGSFVVVCTPGTLPLLQDSIKSSGAPLKDIAFNEEWPWKKEALDTFNWHRIIHDLVKPNKVEALNQLCELFDIVVENISDVEPGLRERLLFEHILDLDFTDEATAENIIKHIGLPKGSQPFDISKYFVELKKTAVKVKEYLRDSDFSRSSICDNLEVLVQQKKVDSITIQDLEQLIDSMFKSTIDLPDVLLFSNFLLSNLSKWNSLTLGVIKLLFQISEETRALNKIDIEILDRETQTISFEPLKIALFHGERVRCSVYYTIDSDQNRLIISRGKNPLYIYELDPLDNNTTIIIDTKDNVFPKLKSNVKLSISIYEGNIRKSSKEITFFLISDLRPAICLIQDIGKRLDHKNFGENSGSSTERAEIQIKNPVVINFLTLEDLTLEIYPDQIECNKEEIEYAPRGGVYKLPKFGNGINPELYRDGKVNILAKTGTYSLELDLIGQSTIERGYTIWDEIELCIKNRKKNDAQLLLDSITEGKIYQGFGSKTKEQIRRGRISREFEEGETRIYPIITNINDKDNVKEILTIEVAALPSNVRRIYAKDTHQLPNLCKTSIVLSNTVHDLIKEYSRAREALLEFYKIPFIEETLDRPLYAVCYYCQESKINEIEGLIVSYLKAYSLILELLKADSQASNIEKYILTHLDTITILNNGSPSIILLGPWHPINLLTHYCLFSHGGKLLVKLLNGGFQTGLNKLIVMLTRSEPIKWFTYYDLTIMDFKKAYCYNTNDPGWKIALCSQSDELRLEQYEKSLEFTGQQFGLNIHFSHVGISNSILSYVSNFLKVYPSARKIWVELNKYFNPIDVFDELSNEIIGNGSGSNIFNQLSGGLHLIFSTDNFDEFSVSFNANENDQVFFYDRKCEDIPIDLKILPTYDKLNITNGAYGHIRGCNENIILSEPIFNTILGPDNLPLSRLYENDGDSDEMQVKWANLYKRISFHHSSIGGIKALNMRLNLPDQTQLGSTWIIVPSTRIDPQIMNQALALNYTSGALWDYKLKFDFKLNSYYIISEIPNSLLYNLKSSGFFDHFGYDELRSLINNISQMGISIGQEAVSSTNKLSGIIGIIGTILSLVNNKMSVFKRNDCQLGFLISVESFRSVLNPNLSDADEFLKDSKENVAKFADLLAIQLSFNTKELTISFSSIESKFSFTKVSKNRIDHGKQQAIETAKTFQQLIEAAIKSDGILERLALKAILVFGLRNQVDIPEANLVLIIKHILNGKLKYIPSKYPQILFTASKDTENKPFERFSGSLMVVNLNPNNWPCNGFDSSLLADLFTRIECNPSETNLSPITSEVDDFGSSGSIIDLESENDKSTAVVIPIINQDFGGTSRNETKAQKALPLGHCISKEERASIIDKLYTFLRNQNVDIIETPIDELKFIEAPAYYKIELKPGYKFEFSKIEAKSRELELSLGLPSGLKTRAYHDRGVAWLEIPKEDHQKITVSVKGHLWPDFIKSDDFRIPFGVDNDGKVVSINFSSSKSPHLLIGGKTGSGKSVLLETLIRGAAHFYSPEELEMYIIDPKGNELIEFQNLSHVKRNNGESVEDAIDLLKLAVEEMENRYARFKELFSKTGKSAKDLIQYNKLGSDQIPRWLIILDEYADLVETDQNQRKEIESLMKRLSSKARAAGIHLIVATQRPSGDVINTTVRANLPGKLALSVDSSTNSRIILDETGAETLSGKGEALFKGDQDGGLVRVQCAIYIE